MKAKRKHSKQTPASKHPATKKTTKATTKKTAKKAPAKQAKKPVETTAATAAPQAPATEAAQKPDAAQTPIGTIANPYRQNCGYGVIFTILANVSPMTREKVIEMAAAEMERQGRKDYRCDFAFSVVTAKKHKSKRPGYEAVRDEQGLWHLVAGETAKPTE